MNELIVVLSFAFVLDFLLGDPVYPLHPTRLIGKLITFFEGILEKLRLFNIFGGFIFAIFVLIFVLSIYSSFAFLFRGFNYYIYAAFEIFVIYSAIALKDMMVHANRVYSALLNGDLSKAQSTLQPILP